MFVLGIDPGVTRCGYGFVERTRSGLNCITAGVLTTHKDDPLPYRLGLLSQDLEELLDELKPDAVVVEKVFFQTNVRTAMSVAQASGLALAAASRRGCDIAQYTANEVKVCLTGDGAAVKAQTQQMVQSTLRLAERPEPPDVADALALAICHLSQASYLSKAAAAANQSGNQGVRA